MDKDKKIDDMILQMRDFNCRNKDLIDSLKKEINRSKNIELENERMSKEIDNLEKEVKKLQNEILSKKKETTRIKKHFEAHIRRLEYKKDTVSDNSFFDLTQKNQILEALLFYIGKKFNFDGELLVDLYKVVDDPNDDFLRRLVDNISESYWNQKKIEAESAINTE